ncbi:glycosyltransferase [Paraburkholderia aromaticivorans]|uniref:glycosyltransferase n=1 Tax=Paraburkholderia aromaticivorans TaxID=2026199 RepID=UPI0038BC817E
MTIQNPRSALTDDQPLAAHMQDLQLKLNDAQQQIEVLEQEKQQMLDEHNSATVLRAEVAKLKLEIECLRSSSSWRITAPVRRLSALARAVGLALETVQRQSAQRGGMSQALSYYAGVLYREGLTGVRKRLHRLNSGIGFADGPPSDKVYHNWIAQYDSLTPTHREEIQARMHTLKRRPVFSIVVPTYNSDERYLREMIESVRKQIYPHWELCIADDASTDAKVREVLEEACALDGRIKVCFRTENGHISNASNSALELARGDFVALLDHDDLVPEHALFMVAQYVNLHPDARMFYSDEDKLTPDGTRTMPYFKSDWNPQLFLTQNTFSHLGVFESALIREAGGFREGFEGSQDYDLALRCLELAGHDKVVHIPHVLYHWRISPGSTAANVSEKPYALIAAIRAIEDHLQRSGIEATVEQPYGQLPILRIWYALPRPAPKVSIIIPTRDGVELLRQCIESVAQKTIYPDYEIIVVDNGSVKDETLAYFEEIRGKHNIRILRDDSAFNFSALNNRAAAAATGDYLCLLNNDIEVISPDWLNELVGLAAQPGNGAVGAALWYPNNTLQHGGVIIGLGGVAGHMHHLMKRGHFGYFGRAVATQNLSAVTAACLVIRKSIYDEVGGLDEGLAVAFNDVDFCLRVREAGYRNVWTPYAELYHHESATRGSDMDPDKYDRFLKEVRWMESRWAGKLDHDPAYNPNLSLSTQVLPFTLADPPRLPILD